ncbi:MAG: hypothetical protein QXU18_11165 [Thermoplasmatales archaeon]
MDKTSNQANGLDSHYVRSNGKYARCALCHHKIRVKDVIEDGGQLYHKKCLLKSGLKDGDKRYAIKAMGLGGAVAGAYLLGVGKLASAVPTHPTLGGGSASESGRFILPGVYSDPSFPLPGQMWYRMDLGITAFRDGIRERNVYSKRVNGYITVSAKGISNGLSNIPNDGADFGPDTPGTTSTGIGEALQYAIDNPIMYNSQVGGYWIMPVHLSSGFFTITKPIVLNVPYRIMNLTLKGVDSMSPYIICAFNTTAADEYPYAIQPSASSVANITYINIQWEHFQINVSSGFSPYGFANFDFSSVNTGQNTFIGYDLNVSNPGFTKAFNLLGFQQIHMYDFENYGGGAPYGSYFDAQLCEFIGGYNASNTLIGGVSNGNYYIYDMGIVINGNCNSVVINTFPNISAYDVPNTFTVNQLIIKDAIGFSSFYAALPFQNSGGTITINKLIMENVTASGLPANENFIVQVGGGSHVINSVVLRNISYIGSYRWVNLPNESTTDGTTAGTVKQVITDSNQQYKKYIIYFSGYENDTATNQSINYIYPFSTIAGITSNTTGLTITASTTGITITAPNNTTLYSGVVIVEGY